jgi:4'-phosphopantetheinyl transferase
MMAIKNIAPIVENPMVVSHWRSNPGQFLLKSNHIHIWKINLDQYFSSQHLFSLLNEDECLRANRLIDSRKKHQFRASRITLREILSLYLKLHAKQIKFKYSEFGKPSIDPFINHQRIEFNLSHSQNIMLLALSQVQPVGIDIEEIKSISSSEQIINSYFSFIDKNAYQQLSLHKKLFAFHTLWTRKEAHAKALGTGFSKTPQMDFSTFSEPNRFREENCWFSTFHPQEGYIASIVVNSPKTPILHFYDYSFNKNKQVSNQSDFGLPIPNHAIEG